jgi:hypothetical protein
MAPRGNASVDAGLQNRYKKYLYAKIFGSFQIKPYLCGGKGEIDFNRLPLLCLINEGGVRLTLWYSMDYA